MDRIQAKRLFLRLTSFKWGDLSLVALCISLVSGVVVALQYEYDSPYYSTVSLDLLVPFGKFFRSLHFYSSQLVFLAGCTHLFAIYRKCSHYTWVEWLKLLAGLSCIVFLLFTGYILRGDSTGTSAGTIAEHILLQVPFVGHLLDRIFFSLKDSGLQRVYVNHVVGLDMVLLFLIYHHIKQFRLSLPPYLFHVCMLLLFCLFYSAPLDALQTSSSYISGPWFFLGLQELLRYLSPLLAGFLLPLGLLFYAASLKPEMHHPLPLQRLFLFAIFLLLYGALSLLAWLR